MNVTQTHRGSSMTLAPFVDPGIKHEVDEIIAHPQVPEPKEHIDWKSLGSPGLDGSAYLADRQMALLHSKHSVLRILGLPESTKIAYLISGQHLGALIYDDNPAIRRNAVRERGKRNLCMPEDY